MDRNGYSPAIRVAKTDMAAFGSDDGKTRAL